jgi:putative oxidoreductase
MQRMISLYTKVAGLLSGRLAEGSALLLLRVALAGIFWRSGRTKVVEGSWLEISDTTRFLFAEDYSAVPLPPDFAAVMSTYAEHALPILLVIGLGTRFAAAGLLGMTLVIQIFVFPEAWWTVHILWVSMAAMLIVRGGGMFSLDRAIGYRLGDPASKPSRQRMKHEIATS